MKVWVTRDRDGWIGIWDLGRNPVMNQDGVWVYGKYVADILSDVGPFFGLRRGQKKLMELKLTPAKEDS